MKIAYLLLTLPILFSANPDIEDLPKRQYLEVPKPDPKLSPYKGKTFEVPAFSGLPAVPVPVVAEEDDKPIVIRFRKTASVSLRISDHTPVSQK